MKIGMHRVIAGSEVVISDLFLMEDIMPIVDRVRQSLDAIFLTALSVGLMIAIAAMILAKLPG